MKRVFRKSSESELYCEEGWRLSHFTKEGRRHRQSSHAAVESLLSRPRKGLNFHESKDSQVAKYMNYSSQFHVHCECDYDERKSLLRITIFVTCCYDYERPRLPTLELHLGEQVDSNVNRCNFQVQVLDPS